MERVVRYLNHSMTHTHKKRGVSHLLDGAVGVEDIQHLLLLLWSLFFFSLPLSNAIKTDPPHGHDDIIPDHPLQHLGHERALALQGVHVVEFGFPRFEIVGQQFGVRDPLARARFLVVDAPHEGGEDGHVGVVGDFGLAGCAGGGSGGGGGGVVIGVGHGGIAVVVVVVVIVVVIAVRAVSGRVVVVVVVALIVIIIHVDVVLFDGNDGLAQQAEGLPHHGGRDVVDAVGLRNRFRQPDQRFQLPDRDAIAIPADPALRVLGAELLVLGHEQLLGLGREFRAEGPGEADVALELRGAEFGRHGLVAVHVDVDDVPGQVPVHALDAVVQHHEEEVEAAHDGRAHLHVAPECLLAVVAAADRVGGREDAGAGVQGGLDAGFGDRDGLLFHGFVDGDLVHEVHFVELVYGADAVVGQHESAGLDGEFVRFFVFDDRGGETGC